MDDQNNVNNGGSTPNGGSAGPVIGIIIILVIIILGGLYFWGQRGASDDRILNEALDAINLQSDSDEVNTIEADLNATDIENLDSEMNAS